jgi:uncharacterized protein YjiS (DUF1127 family)
MRGGSGDGIAGCSGLAAGPPRRWAEPLRLCAEGARYGLARLAAALARYGENRRLLRDLAAMSERELRDIGLSPQDARDAGQLHPAEDVGGLIVARRAERRVARRVRCGTRPGVAGG